MKKYQVLTNITLTGTNAILKKGDVIESSDPIEQAPNEFITNFDISKVDKAVKIKQSLRIGVGWQVVPFLGEPSKESTYGKTAEEIWKQKTAENAPSGGTATLTFSPVFKKVFISTLIVGAVLGILKVTKVI